METGYGEPAEAHRSSGNLIHDLLRSQSLLANVEICAGRLAGCGGSLPGNPASDPAQSGHRPLDLRTRWQARRRRFARPMTGGDETPVTAWQTQYDALPDPHARALQCMQNRLRVVPVAIVFIDIWISL
jgi:hypothetical protein